MQPPHKKLVPLTVILLTLMSFSVSFASSAGIFSVPWNFSILNDPSYQISPHALDSVGQVAYFGSAQTSGPYNFLYAVNITNGHEIWNYDTVQPVNYISHFTYNNSDHIIAGIGGSSYTRSHSYVLAFGSSQNNATLWKSINLNSSVLSLGSVNSSDPDTEDVIAGLANGTVVRLSGNNGTVQWSFNGAGPVSPPLYDIFQLNNGSVIIGNRDSGSPNEGHIYCLEKNGTLRWNYTSASNDPFTLVRKFVDVNNDVPDLAAVFSDGYIYVLDGATGKPIKPWPFKVGNPVTDLLCTQDYTGDGFPDIVAAISNGTLIIINGKNASLFKGPAPVSSFTLSYIQYMNFYKSGMSYPYLNKTLVVSVEESDFTYRVLGVDATTLSVMKEYNTSAQAINLFNIGNFTSNFTGDLLFTVGNTVYCLQGTDVIVPEFTPDFILVSLMISVWFLILILRKHPKYEQ
jgi:outer membrane protein assembly factor BamB